MAAGKTIRITRDTAKFYFYAEQALRNMVRTGGQGFAGQMLKKWDETDREMRRDEMFAAVDPR